MTREGGESWDRVADERLGRWRQAIWRRHCDAVHADLLDRWLPPAKVGAVLKTDLYDEAVGEGLYPLLARRAHRVVGIDVSSAIGRLARRRHPDLDVRITDVRRAPFDDDAFDAIVSNSTLDHLDSLHSIADAIGRLARILRPGGTLVLTMDNPANPAVWLRNAMPMGWLIRIGLVPYPVGVTCGRGRLRRLVEDAGLRTRETAAILHCPRAPAVMVAGRLERARPAVRDRFLRWLRACEAMGRWPTRYLTGYFVALRAVKPGP